MTISHPVYYDVNLVNLVLADVGVSLREEGPWQAQDAQTMGGGLFLSYSRDGVPAGESLTLVLEGEPEPERIAEAGAAMGGDSATTAQAPRDQVNELLVGGGVLLLAVAAGAYLVYLWQQQQAEPEAVPAPAVVEAEVPAPAGGDTDALRESLLLEIAALDDAYEAGEIEPEAYEARRQELKEQLAAIWA
jgi:hypothetical protein